MSHLISDVWRDVLSSTSSEDKLNRTVYKTTAVVASPRLYHTDRLWDGPPAICTAERTTEKQPDNAAVPTEGRVTNSPVSSTGVPIILSALQTIGSFQVSRRVTRGAGSPAVRSDGSGKCQDYAETCIIVKFDSPDLGHRNFFLTSGTTEKPSSGRHEETAKQRLTQKGRFEHHIPRPPLCRYYGNGNLCFVVIL
ncbi:hypothetical protein Bbelb_096300 [Branchiostoma belcheri]|nr:hypothetical protein Bbelb_096300 [Branchiostoma belcheri]